MAEVGACGGGLGAVAPAVGLAGLQQAGWWGEAVAGDEEPVGGCSALSALPVVALLLATMLLLLLLLLLLAARGTSWITLLPPPARRITDVLIGDVSPTTSISSSSSCWSEAAGWASRSPRSGHG